MCRALRCLGWVLGAPIALPAPYAGVAALRRAWPANDAPTPADAEFVALGWGARESFLPTPTWADVTARRAIGALRGGNRALLQLQLQWPRRTPPTRPAPR